MKAVVITAFGGPEVLKIREVETPLARGGELVRVRVKAAALNRADLLQRRGLYPAPPGYPPDIPGMEFAGEVDETGESVTQWKKGQRVFGITGGGAQAEYVVVPANHLAEVPANLDWIQAAAVPEVFITAHDALFTRGNARAGEAVLVHAVGSGVGTAAVQLAHARGIRTFGTSRTTDKLERAKPYGLETGIAVAHDPQSFVTAIKAATDGRGVDVIIDLVGAAYFEANLAALAPKGRLVLVGTPSGAKTTLDIATVMGKRLTIVGTVLRARSNDEKAEATRLFAEQVLPLLAASTVKPIVDSVFSMKDVARAHERLESNETFGKVVILVDA